MDSPITKVEDLKGKKGDLPVARKLLDPSLQALRSVPSIAWVPLFLLWLGIQETSKIALISLGAFFPVYLNLSVAMRHVDPKYNRSSIYHVVD